MSPAEAATRQRATGLVQFVSPVLQLLIAWAVFHEEISAGRWPRPRS
ncbi:hypothetical protein [Actinomyces faecalis]|nr:hypothetical protein [Actinomyces faecalis]